MEWTASKPVNTERTLLNPNDITDQVVSFVLNQKTLGMNELDWGGEKVKSLSLRKEAEEEAGVKL